MNFVSLTRMQWQWQCQAALLERAAQRLWAPSALPAASSEGLDGESLWHVVMGWKAAQVSRSCCTTGVWAPQPLLAFAETWYLWYLSVCNIVPIFEQGVGQESLFVPYIKDLGLSSKLTCSSWMLPFPQWFGAVCSYCGVYFVLENRL